MQIVRIITTLFLFQMAMLIRKVKLVQWGSTEDSDARAKHGQ
jgi:hypothetical protein